MLIEYSVTLDQKTVGRVTVSRDGLYYIINCEIIPEKPKIYRLWAQTGGSAIDLGVCVPYGSHFGLSTRIPIKKINVDNLTFTLKEKNHQQHIVLSEDQPFPYIQQLDKSVFRFKNGRPGILLSQDT